MGLPILLAPHGTRGDVQPMLALGLHLRSRGHEVAFVAPINDVPWITGRGFACEPDGVDVELMLRSAQADIHSLRWQTRYLTKVLAPTLFASVARAAAASAPALIVGAGLQMAGAAVAEQRGVPYVSVLFCPCAVPTRSVPPPPVRRQTLPPWMNGLLWRCGRPLADAVLRGPINAGRERLGLAPVRRPSAHVAGRAVIVAADPDLAPFPADAPAQAFSTDAWVFDEGSPLEAPVEAFLRAGPPPVYLGLGSMVGKNASAIVEGALAATRTMGLRLIVAGGWARLDLSVASSEGVLTIRSAPHRALLPRVAAVAHHGGAGTTTAAARAGVPQLILPHILDQFYWAHRVETVGLGPTAVPADAATAPRVSRALQALIGNAAYADRARWLATRVSGRDGVPAAAARLEQLVA